MSAFAGRYSNQVPEIEFTDSSVTFKSSTPKPEGLTEGRDRRSYDYIGGCCGGHDEQRQTIETYVQFIEQCEEENEQAEEEQCR